MAKELGLSVSETGKLNSHVVNRQKKLIQKMREAGYALDPALTAASIPKSTFLKWYQFDESFREMFRGLEDEQIPLLRQTLRELAAGVHPSCEGVPDKAMLRYIVTEYDKRKGIEDDSGDLLTDLEGMSREQLAKLT